MKREKNGFTLAELLIVVAIIAVLVAISIPIFTSQLEKAREAVDLSNVRSAYSIMQTSIMTGTAPDGNEWPDEQSWYIYTNSGAFQRYIYGTPFDTSTACKLKSNGVELPDFIAVDATYGWKDCVIMMTFDENHSHASMYTWPLSAFSPNLPPRGCFSGRALVYCSYLSDHIERKAITCAKAKKALRWQSF